MKHVHAASDKGLTPMATPPKGEEAHDKGRLLIGFSHSVETADVKEIRQGPLLF